MDRQRADVLHFIIRSSERENRQKLMTSLPRSDSTSPASLFRPAFEVLRPAQIAAPILFNSPHSGNVYPASFVATSKLDPLSLRKSEDAMIDELLLPVLKLGAPLLKVNFPRAYLDVNREPYELDPAMFTSKLPDYVNTTSLRVAGGLGTIPKVVSEAEEIYAQPLSYAQAGARIRDLYLPYHRALEKMLQEIKNLFGAVLLLDCHSMPSSGFPDEDYPFKPRPDIVLGDCYGSSCSPEIVRFLESTFHNAGYSVSLNKPYAGGHITQTYSQKLAGRHTIQIEINRGLYMNEERLEPHDGFICLRRDLQTVIAALLDILPDLLRPARAAAE